MRVRAFAMQVRAAVMSAPFRLAADLERLESAAFQGPR